MIGQALKTILFVLAAIAVAFTVFVQVALLCNDFGVSPWLVVVVSVGLYAFFLKRAIGRACPVITTNSYGPTRAESEES